MAPGDGAAPPGFWDTTNIPPAKNVMTFKFLNRTNGKFTDSEVFWSFKSGTISETHSIADQPTYDMPANNSSRMYFYLCASGDPTNCTGDPTQSPYYDFIEQTIGATQYNGNTTRVDAFGLKIAIRLHCADGFDVAVGEDYETFLEDRTVTFQKFIDERSLSSSRSSLSLRSRRFASSSRARGTSRRETPRRTTTTRSWTRCGRTTD